MRRAVSSSFILVALAGCDPKPSATNVPEPPVSAVSNPTPAPTAGPSAEPAPEASAKPATGEKTLFVREATVDCVGEGPTKCMQVRESPSQDWTLFYGRIKGFDYQEGHRYELRVDVTDVPNPPAGGSSVRTTLIKIVKQEKP